MQNGAMDSGEALQTLRKDVENLCQKFQALVNTTAPMLLPDARSGAEAHAAAIVGSTPGFSQGVDSTLKSLQASNQKLQGLKDARSTRDFALSAVASQKSAVKRMMTAPPRGEGATRVKRDADARQTIATAGADLERACQGLERAEQEVRMHVSGRPYCPRLSFAEADFVVLHCLRLLQYLVKLEQQKAAATTGFAQAGGTCGQLVAQYMAFLHKTLSTAPPAPAPAPVPVPAMDDVPGLDSLDRANPTRTQWLSALTLKAYRTYLSICATAVC
jgi:hypothetical protein